MQSKMKGFNAIKVQNTPRPYKVIAHSLTRLTLEKGETIVWVESYPSNKQVTRHTHSQVQI